MKIRGEKSSIGMTFEKEVVHDDRDPQMVKEEIMNIIHNILTSAGIPEEIKINYSK